MDLITLLPEGFCLLKPDNYLYPNRARREQSFTHPMSKSTSQKVWIHSIVPPNPTRRRHP